ncbi:MAG: pyrroline-5-carboxylate reductase [SAR202 cluster bacterium Io17-Chloro-G4]|nr:MAG: pyrroline-5-carboxylate reductase [SAR202 cluster bacterium Io17-Chloro-G4]
MRLAFIGGGTMAEAILKGVLAAKLAGPTDISVGEPVAARRDLLTGDYGVAATENNLEAVKGADLVVLAIKPQDLPSLFDQLKGKLDAGQTAVSIIAGAKIATLSTGLNHGAVIRVMPNTPAQIGEGMSVWTCSKEVGEQARLLAQSVLDTVGQEVYVDDEKYLDMATAVSGSGPAYVFLIIEALIDAGVYVGLPRETSRIAALQTIYGSTKLVMESGKHPAELKAMVVSPAGTTAEGLQALERAGVPAAIVEAVNAAYLKSIKLGQG